MGAGGGLVFEREKYLPVLCPLQVDIRDGSRGWAYKSSSNNSENKPHIFLAFMFFVPVS